jgi:hypothetical protein
MKKILVFLLIAFFVALGFSNSEEESVLFEEPVLITSGGQSPGALQMMVLAKTGGLDYQFEKDIQATQEDIEKFNTVIIVVGASGKGLGAAGIDVDTEIDRLVLLAKISEELGKKIILAQIEGATRRGASSDKITDSLIEFTNYLLIKEDANEDGKFTTISEENDIPLLFFEKTSDVRDILKELFTK